MIVDFHLSQASGGEDPQVRDFGKRILDAQRNAAAEWISRIKAFLPRAEDLRGLPDGSWLLDLKFTLRKPFSSKSEIEFHEFRHSNSKGTVEFHEIQNPIVRDHLTGLPTVKPTAWKGNLAFAAKVESLEAPVRERLFGTIRGDESGQAGRLHFFPTFFSDEIAREVITPLRRDTRTPARGPIDIEVIGTGKQARFCLLYVPHPKGENWHSGQIAEDLVAASRAVQAMLLDYGFSAKKTSGWGVVSDSLACGALTAKGSRWPEATMRANPRKSFMEADAAFAKFMDPRGQPISQLRKGSGQWLSNKEFRASGLSVGSLGVYKKFRDWYEVHGTGWVRRLAGEPPTAASVVRTYEFKRVSELVPLADGLASSLKGGAGA